MDLCIDSLSCCRRPTSSKSLWELQIDACSVVSFDHIFEPWSTCILYLSYLAMSSRYSWSLCSDTPVIAGLEEIGFNAGLQSVVRVLDGIVDSSLVLGTVISQVWWPGECYCRRQAASAILLDCGVN